MFFRQVFEPNLAQYAYIVGCQKTGEAIVIDPQRDIDRYIEIASQEGLVINAVTETHIHADFLSGAREFAAQHDTMLYLSDEGDKDWKYFWVKDSSYRFQLLKDGDVFNVGNIEFKAVHSPGHTPEHISFLITDLGGGANEPMGLASGDFVFVGDLGRPDLLETAAGQTGAQKPSAHRLYQSVLRFLELPEYLQVWPGHGAGSACGKALGAVPESTVGYEKRFNASIQAAIMGEETFVDAILDGQPEPPLYFARMKHDNKFGPAILGDLPAPALLTIDELSDMADSTEVAVVDTRSDRSAFMARHLAGALYAPLDNTFPTVTGSYIKPEMPIYLIVEKEADIREAVLNLIRIGLDRVAGYATVEMLNQVKAVKSTPEISTDTLELARQAGRGKVLDIRRLAEFQAGHIPGAINVAHTRLLERKSELDPSETYLVHCRTGARSAVATALLERYGFDVVYVNGLYDAWSINNKQETGHPVTA